MLFRYLIYCKKCNHLKVLKKIEKAFILNPSKKLCLLKKNMYVNVPKIEFYKYLLHF